MDYQFQQSEDLCQILNTEMFGVGQYPVNYFLVIWFVFPYETIRLFIPKTLDFVKFTLSIFTNHELTNISMVNL